MEAPVTTEERYSRAITSSHLRASDAACDVDLLITVGAMRDELGPLLYRLRVELDVVRGDELLVQQHRRELQAAIKFSTAQMRREVKYGPPRAAADLDVLQQREQQLQEEAGMAYAKALLQLRSLPAARDALGRWAEAEANRFIVRDLRPHPLQLKSLRVRAERDMLNGPSQLAGELAVLEERRHRALMHAARNTTLTPAVVRTLSGGLLQAFMNPTCRTCCGRGRTGGSGKPEATCRSCGGSGRAQESLGRTDEQRTFCNFAMAEMERMFDAVNRTMRNHLRGRNLRE
jgi:hypothetical protein